MHNFRYERNIRINSFLFLHEDLHCGYSLEVPWQGASKNTHNICFLEEIKNYQYVLVEKKMALYLEIRRQLKLSGYVS